MPNNNLSTTIEVEDIEEENEFEAENFTFIIGPDGELKAFAMPEDLMAYPPEEVTLILKMFGIDNVFDLKNPTIH